VKQYVIFLKQAKAYVGWDYGEDCWTQVVYPVRAYRFDSREEAQAALKHPDLASYVTLQPFIMPLSEVA
jgi:hypothetical protein